MFDTFNQADLKPIPYRVAKTFKPKEGQACWCTPVTWEGAPIAISVIIFRTIGEQVMVQPPTLPRGYRIDAHDNWLDVAKQIYNPEKVAAATFAELDDMVRDWHTLEAFLDRPCDWFNLYSDRPDYCAWTCAFDDSWSDLESELTSKLTALLDHTFPHLDPFSRQPDGIGNRVMAPTLAEALTQMFGADCAQTMMTVLAEVKTDD